MGEWGGVELILPKLRKRLMVFVWDPEDWNAVEKVAVIHLAAIRGEEQRRESEAG